MFHMDLLRPASVQSRPLPIASRASPVLSIQSLEAPTTIRRISTHTRDANRSECPVFLSLRSRLLTATPPSVLDHFSNLGIDGHITASPQGSANGSPEQVHSGENTSGVNTAYASPSSNISNGDSPHPSAEPVRFSLSSELASALSTNSDGPVPYVSSQTCPRWFSILILVKDGTERYNEGAGVMANTVISPPSLGNAPLISNVGRSCYENQYSTGSYSIYHDAFDGTSKVGHYVPMYGNGQAHNGLTNATPIVSPMYSNPESTAVDMAAYRFGTSHQTTA